MWVIAEQENGQLMNVTFELLGAAKELCAKLEEKCCAVLVTAAAGELPQQLIAAGADVVYVVEDAKYADYDTELYTDAICQLSKKYDPASIMFGATDDGRDLAPRVAARLHTGLCADCTALDVTDDKLVAWTRPALGGNICATIICDVNRPQMGTVRPKVFKPAEMDNNRTGEVIAFTPEAGAVSRVELVKKEALSSENAVKIDEADMIAAGGRGFGSKENFDVLEQLAALFENSAVAGTRAAIDEGWLTHSQQVGQSGKSVTPHIYFACGISGAIQHLSGMKDSDIIIAINKDAEAPIFTVAHYGIVGDVNVILPKLIEKIKAYKA
ncbi:electron transfer flavoprotein subunit alpha/FixB family protein [Phascolarctobacterium succinatutens]|jgi:electron transfer flavoprotein alpha subunit|uniref:electron transfer flavoprotein subunit alpha/FixB family protein n=1 Tax=Phascolarctobacterium succinatutens TaxID=626940 RepID=UPI00201B5F00|nr:electron transfer flavoprotein subunit alpha/FixB family protein [Phascolarctobacterium succinatutens]MEE0356542.1 electron transfer flavoprotein subunit alpha/FixB family protein [Phascolarctobacterium succinatutens]UQT42898.1 electron transfer flavoprotein subunit alpha/FixB family protein [Phascolarctobacterium succinatutens]